VALPEGGALYHRNPDAEPETATEHVTSVTMRDIVRTDGARAKIDVSVRAPSGAVSLELRDGVRVLETVRPYAETDLGRRIRVMWSGAEYRGRGRNTLWQGRADLSGAVIERFAPVNRLNPETPLEQRSSASVIWRSVTTGNMMGFDIWLKDETPDARLDIYTNRGDLSLPLADIGIEPRLLDAGGLKRELRVCRLPDAPLPRSITLSHDVAIAESGDTPIWCCATFEDGNQAWTSPTYLFRGRASAS
jgi:hypothetical protein